MGKIEKLIVLGVLFLITVILVVTFTPEEPALAADGGDVAQVEPNLDDLAGTRTVRNDKGRIPPTDLSATPVDVDGSSRRTALPGPSVTDPPPSTDMGDTGDADDADSRGAGTALLNTGVQLGGEREELDPIRPAVMSGLPEGSALKTTAGLVDSFLDDFKLYTWKDGDTYRGLAKQFYGDANRSSLLRQYNEDRYTVEAGMQIFVPVFDVASGGAQGQEAAVAVTPAGFHVVADGESLWTIAKEVYGSGSKWQKIADANKDVLPDPHDLTPGVRLRIP